MRKYIFLPCLILYSIGRINGQISPPLSYTAKYIDSSPTIDGDINEEVWRLQEWSSDFVDIEGDTKPKPTFSTNFKTLYNDTHLFIAAKMEEPHIWAYLTEKNKPIFRYDNDFEVFIDPNGDHCNYYELELNAINTIWELSLSAPYGHGGKVTNPDNMDGMVSASHISGTLNDPTDIDQYWSVEIALPFKEFKKYDVESYPPEKGESWRINFSRVQWDHIIKNNKYLKMPEVNEHNWVWTPQYEVRMHSPEHWGYLFFDKKPDDSEYLRDWEIENQLISILLQIKRGVKIEDIIENLPLDIHIDYKSTDGKFTISYSYEGSKFIYFINSKSCFQKILK